MATVRKTVTPVRREQKSTTKVENIRAALVEGEKSGKPRRFDPEGFKRRMLAPLRGKLRCGKGGFNLEAFRDTPQGRALRN